LLWRRTFRPSARRGIPPYNSMVSLVCSRLWECQSRCGSVSPPTSGLSSSILPLRLGWPPRGRSSVPGRPLNSPPRLTSSAPGLPRSPKGSISSGNNERRDSDLWNAACGWRRFAQTRKECHMLTREQSELITRTGPGTPMGNLFRRHWIPFLSSEEVSDPGCPPVRVKLLSERLIAFRDTYGRLGLIDEF